MSPNKILHDITLEAVSGGVAERRAWLEESGHFRVCDLARITTEEREQSSTRCWRQLRWPENSTSSSATRLSGRSAG